MIGAIEKKGVAYLYALKKVALFRPRESNQLLKRFFEKANLKLRLAALKTASLTPGLSDAKTVGDFFVKIMGASTHEERKELVEPFIEKLLQKNGSKITWLKAYYHGWASEHS